MVHWRLPQAGHPRRIRILIHPMLVLAHRSCHGDVPANTLQAFAASAVWNVDWMDADAKVSRMVFSCWSMITHHPECSLEAR